QSSSDRYEARGASGFDSIIFHAASLTETSAIPGGPARHFCGPATQTSSCQASTSNGTPPSEDTASTSVTAPCARAIGPIAEQSCRVPDGVSEWTTATSSIPGWAS